MFNRQRDGSPVDIVISITNILGAKMHDFEKLKEGLEANHDFPTEYMFKFVVPNTPEKDAEFKSLLPNAKFTNNISKTGKYISYTAIVKMDSPTR